MESTQCPRCESKMSSILETRKITIQGILIIRRTRKCGHCEKQFHTKEVVDKEVEVFQPGKKRSSKKIDPPKEPDEPFTPFPEIP